VAHRIIENVPDMSDHILIFPKNMIVITALPDLTLPSVLPDDACAPALESTSEGDQVTATRIFDQEVQVVRHEAIGQDLEIVIIGGPRQDVETLYNARVTIEYWAPITCGHRDAHNPASFAVQFVRKANSFARRVSRFLRHRLQSLWSYRYCRSVTHHRGEHNFWGPTFGASMEPTL
jgi:hypothetical protein